MASNICSSESEVELDCERRDYPAPLSRAQPSGSILRSCAQIRHRRSGRSSRILRTPSDRRRRRSSPTRAAKAWRAAPSCLSWRPPASGSAMNLESWTRRNIDRPAEASSAERSQEMPARAASRARERCSSRSVQRDDDLVGADHSEVLARQLVSKIRIGVPRIEEVGAVLQLRLLLLELRQLGLPLKQSAMIAAPGEYSVRARRSHGRRRCRRRSAPARAMPRGG